MSTNIDDILRLSKSERISIVEKIWDSIAAEAVAEPLPEWKVKLIDKRLAQHNKEEGVDWNEFKKRYSNK